jgi:hypothetical protein
MQKQIGRIPRSKLQAEECLIALNKNSFENLFCFCKSETGEKFYIAVQPAKISYLKLRLIARILVENLCFLPMPALRFIGLQ